MNIAPLVEIAYRELRQADAPARKPPEAKAPANGSVAGPAGSIVIAWAVPARRAFAWAHAKRSMDLFWRASFTPSADSNRSRSALAARSCMRTAGQGALSLTATGSEQMCAEKGRTTPGRARTLSKDGPCRRLDSAALICPHRGPDGKTAKSPECAEPECAETVIT